MFKNHYIEVKTEFNRTADYVELGQPSGIIINNNV
jgi:hypothetical protein